MGIDVYLRWKDQTQDEERAQYTGFDITAGKVGYLREAYFAKHYATRVMFEECFGEEGPEQVYPATLLKARLPATLAVVEKRYAGSDILPLAKKAYIDFVELAERKEAETGEPCTVVVSY